MDFKQIAPEELRENPVELFDRRWALISAGNEEKHNTMTASWGMIGELWNQPVCAVFIRDSRYTKLFVDASDRFTVSVLPEGLRDALTFCGRKSGRDCDKFGESGLTPFFTDGTTAVGEAELIFVCRKLCATKLLPETFLDESVRGCYPSDDYHTAYIGKIEKVYVK